MIRTVSTVYKKTGRLLYFVLFQDISPFQGIVAVTVSASLHCEFWNTRFCSLLKYSFSVSSVLSDKWAGERQEGVRLVVNESGGVEGGEGRWRGTRC